MPSSNTILTGELDAQTKFWLFFLENYRVVWDFLVTILTSTSILDAVQLLIGSTMYSYFGPLVNFITQLYTMYNLDDFRWGKTRIGIAEKEE